MPDFEQLRLENQLCHAIYSASNALARFYKPILEPLDLTYPQYLIMLALWEKDAVNMQAISSVTYFDSGTLTPLLQKLKEKEYITITPVENDRRNKLVRLTKRGQNLKKKASAIPETLSCKMQLKMKDMETLRALTRSLHEALVTAEEKD